MFEIIFQIENGEPISVSANQGDNLLEVARSSNVAIDAPCSGNASCGKCRVKLLEGDLDSLQTAHISQEDYDAGWRLSCCSKVTGNATVLVPDIAFAYQQRMKTADLSTGEEVAIFEELQAEIKNTGISFCNEFTTVDVQLSEPTLDDTMPDNERLEQELLKMTGAGRCKISLPAMQIWLRRCGTVHSMFVLWVSRKRTASWSMLSRRPRIRHRYVPSPSILARLPFLLS